MGKGLAVYNILMYSRNFKMFLEHDMRSQECSEMRLNWKSQGPYHGCQPWLSLHPAGQNIPNFPTKGTPRPENSGEYESK